MIDINDKCMTVCYARKICDKGGNEKLMEYKESPKKLDASKKQEFFGRLENINISSSGSHFQFDVVSKKDGRRTYMLNSNSPTDYLVMASFISSTCASGKKVTVSGAQNGTGLPYANEIHIGKKTKAVRKNAEKPVNRVKGPVIEAQVSP
jgi:hypothetical protein